MCAYTHGGWAHRQQVSTAFLTQKNFHKFFLCSWWSSKLGSLDLESNTLPTEPPHHPYFFSLKRSLGLRWFLCVWYFEYHTVPMECFPWEIWVAFHRKSMLQTESHPAVEFHINLPVTKHFPTAPCSLTCASLKHMWPQQFRPDTQLIILRLRRGRKPRRLLKEPGFISATSCSQG